MPGDGGVDLGQVALLLTKTSEGEVAVDRALLARMAAEIVRLREEAGEASGLLWRQGDLLRRVAEAVHGPPPPLTTWSHADLPELVSESLGRS